MTDVELAFEPMPFKLDGPLPTGVTLLEASAGTGKTYTIAGLVARYVAGGLPLDQLLVVTFTRLATGELRERVRERLVQTSEGLAEVLAERDVPDDDVVAVLAKGPKALVRRRQELVAKAVAEFDAATIETIHGFCLHVLAGLGVAGDVERGVTFVEDVPDLLDEVVDDLYIRRFAQRTDRPPFKLRTAAQIGRAVLSNPSAEILPPRSDDPGPAAMRGRLGRRILDEVNERKRLAGLLTYEDLLLRLDQALKDPGRGPLVARLLQARYKVALVDEFQDTDLVQWDIVRRAFGGGESTLILIGDPKQAIYAFRGADVHSYLEAAHEAASRATLTVNWRSDQDLIDALDALFSGSQLGHPGIVYRQVTAATSHGGSRLIGAPGAALRVRVVDRDDCGLTKQGWATAAGARDAVAADVAAEVVTLLESGATILGPSGSSEPVHPADLAVLVRTNSQATLVRHALHGAGVPAVTHGSESVFETDAARHWLHLLEALERPTARDRASAAALTPFVGWDAEQVATASGADWEELHWLLHRWAAVLRRHSVAALMTHLSAGRHLPGRVLGQPGGERHLTDLRHLAELLHAAAKEESLGSTALTAWLRRRIQAAREEADDEERSRRLESDAEAVQILTVHRSKGLEFPIVFCPFGWDYWERKIAIPVFHDPLMGGARAVDVGGEESEGFSEHCRLHHEEEQGEDLRLLYVALTRARHQAIVWWAATYQGRDSALSRLMFDRAPDGVVPPAGSRPPSDADAVARFEELVARSGGHVSVEHVPNGRHLQWAGDDVRTPDLERAVLERALDDEWRRTSYSGLTSRAHDEVVGSEPEEEGMDDEDPAIASGSVAEPGGAGGHAVAVSLEASLTLPLGDLPGGVDVGTFVHRVLERCDFAVPDLGEELRRHVDEQLAWRTVELGTTETWVEGLRAALETPLGPGLDEFRLCDLTRGDRLDELGFELPLVGGENPSGTLQLDDVAGLLADHERPDDPLAGYAARLGDRRLEGVLRGYLTGSLDLVLRLPGDRYGVVDYKTNRLGGLGGVAVTAWDYRPAALKAEMFRAHYPLQALLYLVALHRYLRWRVPGYDPDRHLAGAHYLFVRGMSSPSFPRIDGQPCGVWSWQPSGSLVVALSDLFDRGGAP